MPEICPTDAMLEQGIDERRRPAAPQKHEHPEKQDDSEDRKQPPLLVVFEKVPEFGDEGLAPLPQVLDDVGIFALGHFTLQGSGFGQGVALVVRRHNERFRPRTRS